MTDGRVSVGSPAGLTPQNIQGEPAVAIDASHPGVAVAGWIDVVDAAPCPEAAARATGSCQPGPPPPVGISAVGFSFNGGRSWIQPTYTGLTESDCAPGATCTPHQGPIHTVPWFSENGLTSFGDPGVAIGPIPVGGRFSWANGSRVYYSGLTTGSQPFGHPNADFHGYLAATVSRLDNPTPTSILNKGSWRPPVLVDPQGGQSDAQDKPQIWADNAASSPYFGRVYECHGQFHGNKPGGNTVAPMVSVSDDGGDIWTTKQIGPADSNGRGDNPDQWGALGCTIRTDSHGIVYLFDMLDQDPAWVGRPANAAITLSTSSDGGATWTQPRVLLRPTEAYNVDPITATPVTDGFAGARDWFATAPSVDISNGAPTGAGASDEIVLAWVDNGADVNANTALVAWSRDGGNRWGGPTSVTVPGDRPLMTATAISPTGDHVYATYQSVTSPWRGADMTSPRPYHGVFRSAPLANGIPGTWSTVYAGSTDTSAGHNDLRASYPGHDNYQERLGEYVYAAATSTYGLGVWIDARNATVCDAIQDWRARSLAAGSPVTPAPSPPSDCPNGFGNTDVWSATTQ